MQVTSTNELASRLRRLPRGLFAIDGYHGAGKSTVARDVAALLGIQCIHLDEFLVEDQGAFLDFLRYPELSVALRPRPVIVEGVCLLAVLDRLHIKPDTLVYVQGLEPYMTKACQTGPVAAEVLAYHRKFRPAEIADIVYARLAVAKEVPEMDSPRVDVDIAFIQAKTKLSLALAGGGMLTLIIGLAVLLYGVSGQDQTLIKAANIEISASGLGGVIMTTSVVWAFFAYKSRPTYARTRQTSETYDSDARLLERHERESSTETAVGSGKTS